MFLLAYSTQKSEKISQKFETEELFALLTKHFLKTLIDVKPLSVNNGPTEIGNSKTNLLVFSEKFN